MQTQYLYNPNEEKIPEVELYRICYPVTYKEFLENKKEWIKCSTVKLTKDDLYLLNNNSNNNNNNLNNNNSNSSNWMVIQLILNLYKLENMLMVFH